MSARVVSQAEVASVDAVHFCLDAKTNQKNQGCADIGYLRSICAKISETRSQARSNSGDFFTLRFRSGRDADPSEAGCPRKGRKRRSEKAFANCPVGRDATLHGTRNGLRGCFEIDSGQGVS
jgi:hypothetical protein